MVILPIAGILIVLAPCLMRKSIGYGFMLHLRKQTLAYERMQGCSARFREAVAFASEDHVPHAVSLKCIFLC